MQMTKNSNKKTNQTNKNWAYSRLLLGETIAPNLVPSDLKKTFSFEMVKNDIYLGGTSKQNALSSESVT